MAFEMSTDGSKNGTTATFKLYVYENFNQRSILYFVFINI